MFCYKVKTVFCFETIYNGKNIFMFQIKVFFHILQELMTILKPNREHKHSNILFGLGNDWFITGVVIIFILWKELVITDNFHDLNYFKHQFWGYCSRKYITLNFLRKLSILLSIYLDQRSNPETKFYIFYLFPNLNY